MSYRNQPPGPGRPPLIELRPPSRLTPVQRVAVWVVWFGIVAALVVFWVLVALAVWVAWFR